VLVEHDDESRLPPSFGESENDEAIQTLCGPWALRGVFVESAVYLL
jgi:hypothetical protein